ncbi:cytochrome c peroxidase [Ameyamaea chiangmaiensis NBRC 103196]|uniref:C-type cytochrome n=1 Tax=Ameyamaea chiangmaiensis TaxID=442969 RepID=A0A850P764_9PROT|nr:cytochrome c peroxidase [Ameyamaea chiangmaiensis]MBS4074073.1 c-type cytochrome [Ameyamaea chiangmaiensis]NVN40447.1 c-type cytochrome [Ameyamaea chiangmaiensis]GBQ67348.1 cytochrome c peroxidase [Ameyamaea chiangmaiensis NBRC 103196]
MVFRRIGAPEAAAVALLLVTGVAIDGRARAAAVALSPRAELGKALFRDPVLSASGRMSCASCHDPANHYAPSNDFAVQRGGLDGHLSGVRAVPTLTYKDEVPDFDIALENPDGSQSAPGGGHDWDGRKPDIAAQSLVPLLQSFEMANKDAAELVDRVRGIPRYRDRFTAVFGADIFGRTDRAFGAIGLALQAYQHEDASFHAYTSQYDYYTRGLATLTPAQARGMALFNDPERANCAACHTAGVGPGAGGSMSSGQFTDFFFRALGVPRNDTIDYRPYGGYDMGLCGPLRTDLTPARAAGNAQFCGLFITPTLRNVASRHVFFHNGRFTRLRDAVAFYFTRDITPRRWYAKAPRYNDLPPALRTNVDHADMPFTNQKPGARPVANDRDIDDIVAFLGTLTDGYDVKRQRYDTSTPGDGARDR